jgi:hypothetical protein
VAGGTVHGFFITGPEGSSSLELPAAPSLALGISITGKKGNLAKGEWQVESDN